MILCMAQVINKSINKNCHGEKGGHLFLCAPHVILNWHTSLWYLNFDKLYVYTMNIYHTVKMDGMPWEKILPTSLCVLNLYGIKIIQIICIYYECFL